MQSLFAFYQFEYLSLFLLVNYCLNLENNIQDINKIEKIVEKVNLNNSSNIEFSTNEDEIKKLIDSIKIFVNIKNKINYFPSKILNNKEDDKNLILSWLPKIPKKKYFVIKFKNRWRFMQSFN